MQLLLQEKRETGEKSLVQAGRHVLFMQQGRRQAGRHGMFHA